MPSILMSIGLVMVLVALVLLAIPHLLRLPRNTAFKVRLSGLISLVAVFLLFAISLITMTSEANKIGIEGLFGLLSLYYAYDVGKQAIAEKKSFEK